MSSLQVPFTLENFLEAVQQQLNVIKLTSEIKELVTKIFTRSKNPISDSYLIERAQTILREQEYETLIQDFNNELKSAYREIRPYLLKAVANWNEFYGIPPAKKRKNQTTTPFLYGQQNFLEFNEDSLFRDTTKYIAMIEELGVNAVVSLHPRRFGKSLFISMLNIYYDMKNRHLLPELFKGCYIANHLTVNAGDCMVLPLNFGVFNTSNYDVFQSDFNKINNFALKKFVDKYKLPVENITDSSDFASNFINICNTADTSGKKIYVTIDEYDSALTAALSNKILMKEMKINKDSNQDSSKIEHCFKRFFTLLKTATTRQVYVFVTGISPLCLTEFTSGWNHATRISDMPIFADMYGFTINEVKQGIEMIVGIPKEVQDLLLKYCEIYDGYSFHPLQKEHIYNPGRILYFLQQVDAIWKFKPEFSTASELYKILINFSDDTQTRPAESTLKYIHGSSVAKPLLQELLESPTAEIICEVDPRFNLMAVHQDRTSLASFMFFTGALTYAGSKCLKIPNPDARKEFVEAAMILLEIDTTLYDDIKKGIQNMLSNEDVAFLCETFASGSVNERGVRDAIQGETSFQEVVFNRLLVCKNPLDTVNSEYIVNKSERASKKFDLKKKKAIDIVYKDYKGKRRFCFELKNIRIQDLEIGSKYEENYGALKDLSDTIVGIEKEEILQLQLKPKDKCPKWFEKHWAPTVQEFMNKVIKDQIISKYKPELQRSDKEDGVASAWLVVRVGLSVILYEKAF